ncbi:PilZ domain-containing protein [Aquariibacter albus]|uniref:PilZ domain-containing protein n=1 Tax=Aquariibacter albus TaxID=2759899 RepID=A0A839HFY8_9BURK|nr:PilZ domain-containing protein [Aquariibacter albus]MBB1161077.1 PilZ domain-containing protein [Aquariibacter albus]
MSGEPLQPPAPEREAPSTLLSGLAPLPEALTLHGTLQPGAIQLVFRDKPALYAAYLPFLSEGGIFVPTTRPLRLGDMLTLLLTLPDELQPRRLCGPVAWITPPRAPGGRTQGVGIAFPADDPGRALRIRIEEILGTLLASSKPTQTL